MIKNKIITVNGDIITLCNSIGCKIVFCVDEAGYGYAELYYDNKKIGETEFLKQDRVAHTMRTYPYHRITSLKHRLQQYEIVENSKQKGIIRFNGMSAYFGMSIEVTMLENQLGCRFDYKIRSTNAYEEISQQPYAEVNFSPENSKLVFVQYPFQAPITSGEECGLTITPRKYFVPYMFSCRSTDSGNIYMGAGYHLEQEYWNGQLQYQPSEDGGTFKLSPTNLLPMRRQEKAAPLSIVISFAATQSECVAGYRAFCGYDMNILIRRSIDESENLFMSVYKKSSAYREGMGYHQQLDFKTGNAYKNGYGRYITVCSNIGLAHNLYKWSVKHPEETWVKDRIIEMVEFFKKSQREHGGVPNLYHPEEDSYLTYAQRVKETRSQMGLDIWFMPEKDTVYTTHMMSMAAYYLLRLCNDRRDIEKVDCSDWEGTAKKAMDYLMDKVQPDGLIGRNFSIDGQYDDICANVWFLIALDYFHTITGEEKYDEVRSRVENWVNNTFASVNLWCNWSADAGWWRGKGYPVTNHDAFEVPTYATYCLYRYNKTKDKNYIQRAKDALAYLWLCMIPIQFSDFKYPTKGLIKEQDTYSTFDVPFNTTRLFDCLPQLAVISGDRFYMDFYRFIIQVQLSYQAVDKEYPAFYIGLEWTREGVKDALGESDHAYISEFAGVVFLDSINSPYRYEYIGGKDWCIGLDYDPDFKPDFKDGEPIIAFSTLAITGITWDEKTQMLNVKLNARESKRGVIGLKVDDQWLKTKNAKFSINSGMYVEANSAYNPSTQLVEINFDIADNAELILKFL